MKVSYNLTVLFFLLGSVLFFLSGCNKKSEPLHIEKNIDSELDALLAEIKAVEYYNVEELQASAQKLLALEDNKLAQLYGDYYLYKADFLKTPSYKTAAKLIEICEVLKNNKIYKPLAEADILLGLFYYSDFRYDLVSERIQKSFDYCFEPELFIERHALIYGFAPIAAMGSPSLKREEILLFLDKVKDKQWSFYFSRIYLGLAKAYFYSKEYEEAYKVVNYAIAMNDSFRLVKENTLFYELEAAINNKTDKGYQQVVASYKKAIEANRKYGSTEGEAYYRMIGHYYFNEKLYQEAYDSYANAIMVGKINNDSSAIAIDYAYLGWAYFKLDTAHNLKQADKYYNIAINYAKKNKHIMPYRVALERKIWSYTAMGLHKDLPKYKKELMQANINEEESINKNKLQEIKINALLALKSRSQQVEMLEIQNHLQEERLSRQRVVIFAFASMGIFFLLLLWLFFQNVKNLHKISAQKKEISEAFTKLDTQYRIIKEQKDMLVKAIDQIEESNKNLENFAYVAAHDIKTPLRTITTFAGILSQKYRQLLNEKDRELQDFIINSCRDLTNIVNNLLEFSRLSSQYNMLFEVVDLNQLIEGCIRLLHDKVHEKQAIITMQPDFPKVMGITQLLQQLFINVINNSLKFSKENIPPQIEIMHSVEQEGYVTIKIADNGIGIPTKFRREIFQIFKKLNTSSTYEGSGIGLAICQKVVEKHGGRIWVESEEGKGSSFFFTLKLENGGINTLPQNDEIE